MKTSRNAMKNVKKNPLVVETVKKSRF
jgi:hypothetical protein